MTRLAIIFILLTLNLKTLSQFQVFGKVLSKRDLGPIPGASVIEKGTNNGTATKLDGSFALLISKTNAILIISAIGYQEREIILNGQDTIEVKLKESCNIDWFDSRHLGVSLESGILHNPFGTEIDVSSPLLLHNGGIINARYSYQTNFKENKFSNAEISLLHLAVTCDFAADIRTNYYKIAFDNRIASKTYSVQSDLNFRKIKCIAGLSKIDFSNVEKQKNISSVGPLVGAGIWLGGRARIFVDAKVSIYKNLAEYQFDIDKSFKRINTYIRFYKIDNFCELSIGAGKTITYRLKKVRR